MPEDQTRGRRLRRTRREKSRRRASQADDPQESSRAGTRRPLSGDGGQRQAGRKSRRLAGANLVAQENRNETAGPVRDGSDIPPRAHETRNEETRDRSPEIIVVEDETAAPAVSNSMVREYACQEEIEKARSRRTNLQLEVTERLLKRVDDYVEGELGLANVSNKIADNARVVGRPGDERALKRKVSEYVKQYIVSLLKYRKAHADPYGDGIDRTCVMPMINIPQGSRNEPLPGKQLFDAVSSYGLQVKLPDGLRTKRGGTRNNILLAFSCFSAHRKTQNYLPFLRPNHFLEKLPGFASPSRDKTPPKNLPDYGDVAFLWKALLPNIDRYDVDTSQFEALKLPQLSSTNCFFELRHFWEDYATLGLMRRVQRSVKGALERLSMLLKENRPEFWLEAKDSTFYEEEKFSLISFRAKESWKSFYTAGRNKLMKDDICALYIFGEEEGSEDETRILGYIWKIEGDGDDKRWKFWVPGRWLTRKRRLHAQAIPMFQCISELRRAVTVSRFLRLHRSLAQPIFCPRSAADIQYRAYCHLPDDEAAQKVYWHYKERLNESQFQVLDKIMKALSTDQRKEGCNVIAVQGPPGTGKSTVIVSAVALLLAKMESDQHREKRILVCAPSNAAVDVLARRMNDGIEMAVVEQEPYSVNILKQTPSLVRIGPECTDSSLDGIRVKKLVSRKIEIEGKHDGEFPEQAQARARKEVLTERKVWCSTLMNIMSDKYDDKEISKDVLAVIVDEAGQALEIDCLMPLLAFAQEEPPLFILVGDTKQLPPYEDISEGKQITEQSLLSRIVSFMQHTSNNCARLNVQYRMHYGIARFPSLNFYNGSLRNAPCVYDGRIFERPYHFDHLGRFGPVTFIDTKNIARNKEYYPLHDSACNYCEAEVIKSLVVSLVRLHNSALQDGIVLLSPYSRQLEVLSNLCKKVPEMAQVSISTSTIDAMQGGETGIIIMSAVRSNQVGELGFLIDYRRVNVGMTRARFSLVVVGNSETLESERAREIGPGSSDDDHTLWKRFVAYCKNGSKEYTHYVCPTGRNISDETVVRELFPESIAPSAIKWDHPRFQVEEKKE